MRTASKTTIPQEFQFKNAFYIKLGLAGCWEKDSIENDRMRIGWTNQALDDINSSRWDIIKAQLDALTPGKPQVATADLHRLQDIALSTPDDVWVTFHGAKLWWTRLDDGPVEADEISKFRRTVHGWHDTSLTGKLLLENDLPGKLAMLKGFRATACRVRETALLRRVIEGTRSALAAQIAADREALVGRLEQAICGLHWKDYETLVDMVFRNAGWRRISVLGQQAKAYDLELQEPITGDRYLVQIKSQAGYADLKQTIKDLSVADFRKVFFVVHSPDPSLANAGSIPSNVELVRPRHLAALALSAGLTQWIEDKVA